MEHNRENLLDLIRSGLDRNDLSIAALERHAGVAKDTIRDFLRGKTQVLRADKLQKILQVLAPEEKVSVSGQVGPNAEITPLNSKEELDCPPGFSASEISAVRVMGDAMLPLFHDGWIIYYSTQPDDKTSSPKQGWHVPYNKPVSGEPLAEFMGKPAVVKLTDGRIFLRTLKPGSKPGYYNLAGYNAANIADVEIASVARIVFIKT